MFGRNMHNWVSRFTFGAQAGSMLVALVFMTIACSGPSASSNTPVAGPSQTPAAPSQSQVATTISKEQALAIVSEGGEKQLGNWINIERRASQWHFEAIWKSGGAGYYIVDAKTKSIVYANPDSKSMPVPESLLQGEVKESYHIVDQGITPIIWERTP